VPEVMAESGARLVDVGTTNRTRLADYSSVLGRRDTDVALVLKVHPSNYRIEGFTEGVEVAELATLDVPVVVDIGSGLLDAACPWVAGGPPAWVRGERAARQTLEAGAAAVTFSGDKLLGGPQAGIIAGRRDIVETCARHPLARALRAGGLTLAALQATALAYLSRDGNAIPFWRMATIPVGDLRARADAIGAGKVVETQAVAGAGSLPGTEIPSVGLAVPGDHTTALRGTTPLPIIARVHDQITICDLRTVDPTHDAALASALRALA
jgi:L-seryl-tRNA(Ser) seleniumtransferase